MMKLSNKFQNSNYNLKTNKNKRESIQENYDVFGKELRLLVESRQLPELICMLGYMIKNYGVLSQGLFRISGNKTRMDELRTLYSQSKRLEVGIDDIHNITGLFKSFLREVPGGVIPCPQSLDLIKAARMYKRNENLDLLTNELLKLPVPHYNLLKFTCSLLYQVSRYSASNLMTPDNLGTVFGPTFFASVEDMSLLPIANSASTVLIHNYNDLFKVSAPVHTNLNQTTENNQRFDDVNGDVGNGYVTKNFADHITTIKFGESSLLFNSNGEAENSLFSYSIHDEEPIPFPETTENFNPNNSYPTNSQFSNSLDMALRMCLTKHLFNQFQENEFAETDQICTPRLISDVMLNPQIISNVPDMKQSSSNSQMRAISKKKQVEEASTLSLPRREISSNILQSYLSNHNTDPRGSDMIGKSDSSQTTSDIIMNNEQTPAKQSHPVPQLDLSILYDTPGLENVRSPTGSKNQDLIKNKFKANVDNTRELNTEPKTSDTDSSLNQIKKSITNLKRQLRQFEDEYYSMNGVRPDKTVRANDEWYSRAITELKSLRREKEQLMNNNDRTDDYESAESGRNVKKKTTDASGDVTDHRPNFGMSPDNRSVVSRPVSALSEIAARMTPSNESGRSNTLNSMGTVTNHQAPDLSQAELDNLKIALEKISGHLMAERIRDNRPTDLDSMTQQQIETEKVSMQKALLNFESTYGRKKTPNAVYLMRPLYDRYRQVKKRLFQMNETQGLEWKIAQRTLNSQPKMDICQSAWTSDRPLSSGLQSLNRGIVSQANNRTIYIPTTSQIDIGEEFQSPSQRRHEQSANNQDTKSVNNNFQQQQPRRNVRTINYRRASTQSASDPNNNKRLTIQRDELQQLTVEKKELQKILKDFENNFERDTNRKVEKLDRLPMDREYNRYKFIKNRIKELEQSPDGPLT